MFHLGLKQNISKLIFRTATLVSPYWNTQLCFLRACGRCANLKQPNTFSEKLSWLKLNRYAHDPLVKQCADKFRLRDYAQQKGLGDLLVPLIDVYHCPEDVNWGDLPNQFVLKWNFGCGFNLICRDKNQLDCATAVQQLKKWQHDPFWLEHAELQYHISDKRILCEQYLDTSPDNPLLDYKIYCFHGKPLAILVIARPEEGEKAAVFMSPNWDVLSDIPARYQKSLVPERPNSLIEMLHAARVLSEPFPFVRVDFYEHNGKALLGEMTFTPAAGIFPSETKIDGKTMGDYIDLDISPEERS